MVHNHTMRITVIYIHACVGLKHYHKFFKYPNSLFIMNHALTFSRACTRPHPSHPPSAFSSSIAQIRLFTLGRSPMVCVGPSTPYL